jgi:hypothetical protein
LSEEPLRIALFRKLARNVIAPLLGQSPEEFDRGVARIEAMSPDEQDDLLQSTLDRRRASSRRPDAIHNWFGLSYAKYLVVQRSILQSMPDDWQARFVACLKELDEAMPRDTPARYSVQARDWGGRIVHDKYRDYERGRRRVELRRPVVADQTENATSDAS